MDGTAVAPAAGTVLNALATERGSAFAIDVELRAEVSLTDEGSVTGTIAEDPGADTRLIERCVELVTERFGDDQGGTVRTESDIPLAAGLKSSSAAANATVLATLSALDATDEISKIEATRIGVQAAREVGVTATGAFDDATASMLGGVTVTDNTDDELLAHEPLEWDVLVWTPPEQSFSAEADVSRCRQVAPMADLVEELALEEEYGRAMTVNGLAFAAALDFSPEPLVEAMPHTEGVSLSGTGPSVTAVGNREDLERVRETWEQREGRLWYTTTQRDGARTI